MLSVIIATHESERTLVPTLAALVPGATAGLLREVVIADAGSKDETAKVADIAGCRFISSNKSLGARLRVAAESTRTPWLLFLRAGTVLEAAWIDAVGYFMEAANRSEDATPAAIFRRITAAEALRPKFSEAFVLLLRAVIGDARPEQGLLIARHFYDKIGGHRDEAQADAALLRRLGHRQIVTLRAGARLTLTGKQEQPKGSRWRKLLRSPL